LFGRSSLPFVHLFPFFGLPEAVYSGSFGGVLKKSTHKTADEPAASHDMAMKMQAKGRRFVDGR
jgi:hypothetical protein